ncbi:L,D-transpeptidase family protein [Halomonas sp. M20]|uniref:L,D-transpeptidase family protein n=1 Tax=Halomonas sp. M20 TaxID=2763264 RepID=UPI001D0B49C7|nr:L,D-transpeptidase family protein [Halomonas sp. M20]
MHPRRRQLKGWALLGALAFSATTLAEQDTAQHRYPLPEQGEIVGQTTTVTASQDDTLLDLGLGNNVGYNAITQANPDTSIWLPGEGTEVLLPTRYILPPGPREGIVINLAELRLYYYSGEPASVETYPIGIGRMDWKTPLGTTQITAKVEQPSWYPPQSVIAEHAENGDILPRVVPPGPDNPLGDYAIILGIPGYLIHGTNRPDGVGMRVSHGCIRMLSDDIENLIYRVPKGTTVRLINQPVKFGWTAENLLEIQAYSVPEETPEAKAIRIGKATETAIEQANARGFLIDNAILKKELENPSGIATSLLLSSRPFPLETTFYDRLLLHYALYSQLAATVGNTDKLDAEPLAESVMTAPVEARPVETR